MKKYNVLGVILARSGSKGIKKKNIKLINGHPLISYSIYAGIKSKYITKLIVSTDSNKISSIAKKYGAEVPFLRPKKLAGDNVPSKAALKYSVLKAENFYKKKFDYIVELPAVAPCRTNHDVDKALKKLFTNKYDSVISFTRVYDKHPLRMKVINKSGFATDYDKKNPEPENSRRQDYAPCYVRNGAIYSMKRSTIIKKYSRMGKKIKPYIMDELKSVNIDEITDFYTAEKIIESGWCQNNPSQIIKEKNKIRYEDSKKNKSILISYSAEFFAKHKKEILKKYNIIFSNIKNVNKIKKKYLHNIKAWLVPTNGLTKINRKNLKFFQNLKFLVSPATGTTHLDLPEIKKRKIQIIKLENLKETKNIFASSEFCLLLILATLRKIKGAINVVNKGGWRNQEKYLRSNEISKFNFGIFGYGRIGKNVYKHLNIMKAKVNIYDPYINIKKKKLGFKKINNLSTFLKKTDFLLISSNVKKNNYGFFNYSKLKLLKKNAIIVNISRGEIVNEKDLLRLLKEKHLSGYGADIVSREDKILNGKSRLINFAKKHDNVLISPHVAGLTHESEKKAIGIVVKKVLRVN